MTLKRFTFELECRKYCNTPSRPGFLWANGGDVTASPVVIVVPGDGDMILTLGFNQGERRWGRTLNVEHSRRLAT